MSQIRDSARANARTISVTVAFSADLRRFLARGADGPQGYTMPEGATVADLLAVIGVEADAELIIAVDGELAGRNTPLRDGAEVMLLHPMEGGSRRRGDHSDADLTAGNVGSRKGVLLSHQAVKSPLFGVDETAGRVTREGTSQLRSREIPLGNTALARRQPVASDGNRSLTGSTESQRC
jgi:sulfur carrier protein ThiS